MKQNIIETLIGFVVLIVALLFFLFAYNQGSQNSNQEGYMLRANFQSVEGILTGSDVMIAGIKVGAVKSLILDNNSFMAKMELVINNDIKIPADSQAVVASSGLLGGKYIMIVPGADDEILKDKEQIKMTQSAVNLESLIGKLIYSISNK